MVAHPRPSSTPHENLQYSYRSLVRAAKLSDHDIESIRVGR